VRPLGGPRSGSAAVRRSGQRFEQPGTVSVGQVDRLGGQFEASALLPTAASGLVDSHSEIVVGLRVPGIERLRLLELRNGSSRLDFRSSASPRSY
jgi:hypothetical protein